MSDWLGERDFEISSLQDWPIKVLVKSMSRFPSFVWLTLPFPWWRHKNSKDQEFPAEWGHSWQSIWTKETYFHFWWQNWVEYGDHTFFHALTFAMPRGSFLNTKPQDECSNIFRGIRQMLIHWNKHVWSLFLRFIWFHENSHRIRLKNHEKVL